MERISELSQVIKDVERLRKEIEKEIGAIDLTGILKRVKNPGRADQEIIQKLLALRDKITSTLKPFGQLRDKAIEERIKIEQKGPLSE